MAHSHHLHREHQVSHRRVDHLLKHEPEGAKQHNHSHAFSKVTSKSAAEHHDGNVAGKRAPKRYAKGGRVKGKHHQTNIAIVVPPHQQGSAPAGTGGAPAPMGAPPPSPMGAKPPMPMPAGPPGAGSPPGMPPGMPMRKAGGRIKNIDGEATEGNIKSWEKRSNANSYYTGGAITGVGRLEKARKRK